MKAPTKIPTPKLWKHLPRHPLSTDYEDITGVIFDEMVATVKEYGVVDRRITLHEDQVLDGSQLLRACIEADVEPEFCGLPERVDAETFVKIKNDLRRQSKEEQTIARLKARRERVAAARIEGKSLRAIAEQEDVSEKTVRRDIEEVTAAGGDAVTTPEGKVTGRDGRQQPATKPKPAPLEPPSFDDEPPKEAKKPKAGRPKWDDKSFEAAFGPLVRFVDNRALATGKGPKVAKPITVQIGNCHDVMQGLLGELIEVYKLWKKQS